VPAHDQRDWEFARRFGLPSTRSSSARREHPEPRGRAYLEHGRLVNSGRFDGLDFDGAFAALAAHVRGARHGKRRVNWRLRDWGIFASALLGCPIR